MIVFVGTRTGGERSSNSNDVPDACLKGFSLIISDDKLRNRWELLDGIVLKSSSVSLSASDESSTILDFFLDLLELLIDKFFFKRASCHVFLIFLSSSVASGLTDFEGDSFS